MAKKIFSHGNLGFRIGIENEKKISNRGKHLPAFLAKRSLLKSSFFWGKKPSFLTLNCEQIRVTLPLSIFSPFFSKNRVVLDRIPSFASIRRLDSNRLTPATPRNGCFFMLPKNWKLQVRILSPLLFNGFFIYFSVPRTIFLQMFGLSPFFRCFCMITQRIYIFFWKKINFRILSFPLCCSFL